MKDDAVAPVIAVLLILAAIATFVAVWNATVLPSLKEQSEMVHLQSVETSFARFSSDIETAVSLHQNGLSLSEPVQLGGGDILFNNVRSGGSLKITNEEYPLYNISVGSTVVNGTLVSILYEPSGNFWQDQGYRWQYGYINVTKHKSGKNPLQTPLYYADMDSVIPVLNTTKFWTIGSQQNYTGDGTCGVLDLYVVNLRQATGYSYISGNGIGNLKLESNVSSVSVKPPTSSPVTIVINQSSPIARAVFSSWNSSVSTLVFDCPNLQMTYDYGNSITISQKSGSSPVTVALHPVNISISAY